VDYKRKSQRLSKKPPLRDIAYSHIKNSILSGQLQPGEAILENDICEVLDLSRTPVREAIRQLANENLIEMIPRRGAFVCEISISEVKDVFQLREILDCMAVRLACGQVPTSYLDEFDTLFNRLVQGPENQDAHEALQVDRRFHELILDSCGNKWLRDLTSLLLDKSQLIRIASVKYPGRMKNSWLEHLQLISYLRANDSIRAEECALQHVINARNAVLRAVSGE
jgi:DNA-binding GntR family transcriptional regulator